MTEKHFEAIAKVLSDLKESLTPIQQKVLFLVTRRFIHLFESLNDQFDRGRFLKACGY